MTRRFLLVLAAGALLCSSTHAQTPAGRWLVTGGISLYSNSSTDPTDYHATTNGLGISPSIGYFVVNHLAIGLTGGAGYTRNEQTVATAFPDGLPRKLTQKNTYYRLALFGRYYWHLSERTAITATLSGGLGRSQQEYREEGGYSDPGLPAAYNRTDKGRNVGAQLTPAFVFFPTPKLGLEVTLGSFYVNRERHEITPVPTSYPSTGKNTNTSAGATFSFYSLGIGGSYFFGGGQAQ